MDNRKPVLLFSGEADRKVIACIRSLENHGIPYYIMDSDSNSGTFLKYSKYFNKIIKNKYPSEFNSTELKNSLLEALDEIGSEIILYPISGRANRILIENTEWLEKNGITLPLSSFESYVNVSDKRPFVELVQEYGMAVPPFKNTVPDHEKIPFVAKPIKNRDKNYNKNSPYLINSKTEYIRFHDNQSLDEYFFQEYIDGDSIYYFGIYQNGSLLKSFGQINLLQMANGGSMVKSIPTKPPVTIERKINNMMSDLNWQGVLMIEFKYYNNKYYMIEANPRFWGPLQLCVDNNVHFPALLYYLSHIDVNIPDQLVNSNKNTNLYGYFRHDAYLEGRLKQLHGTSQMTRYNTDFSSDYVFRDPWLRSDTIVAYLQNNGKTVLSLFYQYVKKIYENKNSRRCSNKG